MSHSNIRVRLRETNKPEGSTDSYTTAKFPPHGYACDRKTNDDLNVTELVLAPVYVGW